MVGMVTKLLNQLLKKRRLFCNKEMLAAFEELIQDISAGLDFSKPIVIEADASSKGLGEGLLQEGRFLAFWSKALSERAQNKSMRKSEFFSRICLCSPLCVCMTNMI